MASVIRTPLSSLAPPLPRLNLNFSSPAPIFVSLKQLRNPRSKGLKASIRIGGFMVRASSEEVGADSDVVVGDEIEDDSNGAPEVIGNADEDASDSDQAEVVEPPPPSPVITALQAYKEALTRNDESKILETETLLKSLEDEKFNLEAKVAALSQELSTERDRVLRISADFENFRRRTERDRLSLVENAQGEVVESLLQFFQFLIILKELKLSLRWKLKGRRKLITAIRVYTTNSLRFLIHFGWCLLRPLGQPSIRWVATNPARNSVEYLINFFSLSPKLIQV